MVFSNLFFIYLFLPLNLILYFVVKNRTWQNIVLLGFSLFFYAWGEPVWVFMLMLTAFWTTPGPNALNISGRAARPGG